MRSGDTREQRSVSQEHCIDLCRLLGHETPGESRDGSLAFVEGASKQRAGQGWADIWKKGCWRSTWSARRGRAGRRFPTQLPPVYYYTVPDRHSSMICREIVNGGGSSGSASRVNQRASASSAVSIAISPPA
jgi:hypothetical protein